MNWIFEAAMKIQTSWALSAFAMACVVFLAFRLRGTSSVKSLALGGVIAVVGLALASLLINRPDLIYRVRVSIVGPQGTPTEEAKVWSSMGGEAKKVAGGWEFDIPNASRPRDGKLTVWASEPSAFLLANKEIVLSDDHQPSVTLQLAANHDAKVHGTVLDVRGRGIAGARVSISGYAGEEVVTHTGGNFELAAHAPANKQVLLHVEWRNRGVTQWHPAGDVPASVVLE